MRFFTSIGFAAAGVCVAPGLASAAIILTADPDYPADAQVFTVDPVPHSPGGRGIAGTRNLRQSFQLGETLTVQDIVLSQVVGSGGINAGYVVEIYEVADVNAGTFVPLGPAVASFTIPTTETLPTTSQRLGFTLTGDDQFVLAARNTGTEGYAIEMSNADGVTTIGNLRHSNSGVDLYPAGTFYTETGSRSGATRDLGLAISGTVVPEPATAATLLGLGGLSLLARRRRRAYTDQD